MPDFVLFLIITCSEITGSTVLDLNTQKYTPYYTPYGFFEQLKGKDYIVVPRVRKEGLCA